MRGFLFSILSDDAGNLRRRILGLYAVLIGANLTVWAWTLAVLFRSGPQGPLTDRAASAPAGKSAETQEKALCARSRARSSRCDPVADPQKEQPPARPDARPHSPDRRQWIKSGPKVRASTRR